MGVIEAVNGHAAPAELHHHIGARGQLRDASAPFIKDLRFSLTRVRALGDRSADMIEHQARGWKSSGQRCHFRHLEVIAPAVEDQVALDEFGESGSEVRVP